jgi:hypothetical protein
VALVCQIASDNPAAQLMLILVDILAFALAIFMGRKGNEITAKNYLTLGWRFTDPNSEITRFAKMKWPLFESDAHEPPTERAFWW